MEELGRGVHLKLAVLSEHFFAINGNEPKYMVFGYKSAYV